VPLGEPLEEKYTWADADGPITPLECGSPVDLVSLSGSSHP